MATHPQDSWNRFDLVLVLLAVLDLVVSAVQANFVRALRILRMQKLLRLLRAVRLVKVVKMAQVSAPACGGWGRRRGCLGGNAYAVLCMRGPWGPGQTGELGHAWRRRDPWPGGAYLLTA